jgi:intergrase/recombinase
MKRLFPLVVLCLAACDGGGVRQRTGDADVGLTPELINCAVDKEMAEVVDFLNTPSGTEEEDIQMSKALRAISKACTDNAIINTDAVELRYELKKKVN